jgi:hypothetical protein
MTGFARIGITLLTAVVLVACGSSGGTSEATITGVHLSGASPVTAGFPLTVEAAVTGTGAFSNAVDFTVVTGSGVIRATSPDTALYFAPPGATGMASIKGTSHADPSRSDTLTVTMTAPDTPLLDITGAWSGLFYSLSVNASFTSAAVGYSAEIWHPNDATCLGVAGTHATGTAVVSGNRIALAIVAPNGNFLSLTGNVSTPPDGIALSQTTGFGTCSSVTGSASFHR